MIQEFTVQNFRSIRDSQTISFLANNKIKSDSEEYLTIPIDDNFKLLKVGVLYGYNASGKSNLMEALEFLRLLAQQSPDTKDIGTGFVPFCFDNKTVDEPGFFSITFFVNEHRYRYQISVGKKQFYTEQLEYLPLGGRRSRVFVRSVQPESYIMTTSYGDICKFSTTDKLILNGNTLQNGSVLAAYLKTNVRSEILDEVLTFFQNVLLPNVTPKVLLQQWSMERFTQNLEYKDFYINFMKKADFQISDLHVKADELDVNDTMVKKLQLQGTPEFLISEIKKSGKVKNQKLLFTHATTNGGYPLDAVEESEGTMRYFGLGGILRELLSSPHFVCIDEIESSLHPALVSFFLQTFLLNSDSSQVFMTTHNQSLMDQDYMRKDMVWFCEKDGYGASQYYCADEFKVHKNIHLSNLYKIGKLGAVPSFGSPFMGREGHEYE